MLVIPFRTYKFDKFPELPTEEEYWEYKKNLQRGLDLKIFDSKKSYIRGVIFSELLALLVFSLFALVGFLISLIGNVLLNVLSALIYIVAIGGAIGVVFSLLGGLGNLFLVADYEERFKLHVKGSKDYEEFIKYFKVYYESLTKLTLKTNEKPTNYIQKMNQPIVESTGQSDKSLLSKFSNVPRWVWVLVFSLMIPAFSCILSICYLGYILAQKAGEV